MKLIKTSLFSAIITFIRIASGFIAAKVIAVLTGASGIALIGNFSNFIAIVLTFSNGAVNNGVIKYTAEGRENEKVLKSLFSTAFRISVTCSVAVGFFLICLAPQLSLLMFSTNIYRNVIYVFGFTIIFYSLNTLLVSILNGKGEIKTYTIVNTAGNLISLILTIVLVYFFKISGALYALVLSQSVLFFVSLFFIYKSPWFSFNFFTQRFEKKIARKLFNFSLMAITSAATVPISQLFLRNMVIDRLGIDQAGYWQGMMRVSDGYLVFITTSLSIYYLPKLSSILSKVELRREIFNGYKLILPIVIVSCFMIFYCRFFIIKILYTNDFLIMEKLFFWQLVGDFFKIASWILSYLMVAKAMTRTFIVTEIVFSLSYVALGYLFVNNYGIGGLSFAFAVNYFIYFVVMVVIFRKMVFNLKSDRAAIVS